LIRISRRLERLEARAAMARKDGSYSARMVLVHPEKGATGVFVIESGKPMIKVPPTPEDIEWVRADLEKHRAGARNT
jgi:phosphopantothenate synthetase